MGELPSGVAELESELGPWPFAPKVAIYMCHSSVFTRGGNRKNNIFRFWLWG